MEIVWFFKTFYKFPLVFIVLRWRQWNQNCTSALFFYGRKSVCFLWFSFWKRNFEKQNDIC